MCPLLEIYITLSVEMPSFCHQLDEGIFMKALMVVHSSNGNHILIKSVHV